MTPHDLIQRVEGAERGSAELDRAIARALGAEVIDRHGRIGGGAYRCVPWVDYDTTRWQSIPDFSRSLDAALALVEAKLPGWTWGVDTHSPPKGFCAILSKRGEESFDLAGDVVVQYAPTAPLAVLAALLSALQAQGDTDEG